MMAEPIGVSPLEERVGGSNWSAVVKWVIIFIGPKVRIPISTRFAATESAINSSFNAIKPALSSLIGRPCIDPDVSSNKRHGHRGSGLSAKPAASKGTCSNSVIGIPHVVEN